MKDFWKMELKEALPYAARLDDLINRAGARVHTEIPSEMDSAVASIRTMWEDVNQGLAAAGPEDRVFDLEPIFHLLLIAFEAGFCIGWYLHKSMSGGRGENLLSLINRSTGERELISGNRMPGVKHEYDDDFIALYTGGPYVHGYLTVVAHFALRKRDLSDVQARLITVGATGFVFGYIACGTP